MSGMLNNKGQSFYYGKVAGTVITGNEDGVKHCAMSILYALQHLGYTIPPQADCGWIGEAGQGPSYGDMLDTGPAGFDNDFTQRNSTIMTWNLMHLARILKDAGSIPIKAIIEKDGRPAAGWTTRTRSTGLKTSSCREGAD